MMVVKVIEIESRDKCIINMLFLFEFFNFYLVFFLLEYVYFVMSNIFFLVLVWELYSMIR